MLLDNAITISLLLQLLVYHAHDSILFIWDVGTMFQFIFCFSYHSSIIYCFNYFSDFEDTITIMITITRLVEHPTI